jgi:Partial alpha/beta-hydrolase lipase region
MLPPKPVLHQQTDKPSSVASPTLTEASYDPLLQAHVNNDRSNVDNSNRHLGYEPNGMPQKHADETALNPLFPPLPLHYSAFTALSYHILSASLSLIFLIFVVTCAMIKTLPSVAWISLSWCQFKNPDRLRPLYHWEKERKHIPTGKLKCDIEYYAERQGLDCKEYKVETEDGFILTIHHIIEKNSESIDSKSKIARNQTND